MIVELTDEQEAVILDIAERDGKSPAEVLTETAAWLKALDDEEEERIVQKRIAEADRGVSWISQEEMELRLQAMLRR